MTGCRHPVGRQLDPAYVADIGCRQVGDRLAHRHAARGRGVEQGQRGAFAHGEAFAAHRVVTHRRDRDVGHRHLPGPHHLVARGEAADTAIADGDQEVLRGHRRQAQHAQRRLFQVDRRKVQRQHGDTPAARVAAQFRCLAEQHFHRHVHRLVAEVVVLDRELPVAGGDAEHGERTALAFAQGAEFFQALRCDGQHVALLRFVAPDLARAHARLFAGDRAQVEGRAAAGVVGELGHGVGNTAGADVVDGQDRIGIALLPTAVDDFLGAALDFRVAALHRGEIEVGGIGPGRHRGCRAAAEADQHAGAAELDQQAAGRKAYLEGMFGGDVAQAAGDHDRLVVAAHLAVEFLLERAEIARQVGPAEFVVEGRGADRAFDHDVERRGDALRFAVIRFPRLDVAGNPQVGDREAAEPGLGLGAAAGGALVADLAAGAGGSAGKGRDRGRMVVRFDFGQDVREFLAVRVAAAGARVEAADGRALDHRGVVRVGHYRALGMRLVRFADHAEQGQRLRLAIHRPARVENLVPAMFGIGLGEHHQFDVGRIAPEPSEVLQQVVDLVGGKREAQFGVGRDQRSLAAGQNVHRCQRLRRDMMEQRPGRIDGIEHRLGHAVVEPCRQHRLFELASKMVGNSALDAFHRGEAAIPCNVGGFRTPGRYRAKARRDQQQFARRRRRQLFRDAQQILQPRCFGGIQRCVELDEIPVFGVQPKACRASTDTVSQARQAGRRKRGNTPQGKEFSHDGRTGAGGGCDGNSRRRIIPCDACRPCAPDRSRCRSRLPCATKPEKLRQDRFFAKCPSP